MKSTANGFDNGLIFRIQNIFFFTDWYSSVFVRWDVLFSRLEIGISSLLIRFFLCFFFPCHFYRCTRVENILCATHRFVRREWFFRIWFFVQILPFFRKKKSLCIKIWFDLFESNQLIKDCQLSQRFARCELITLLKRISRCKQ